MSQNSIGLAPFVRNCARSPLIETPPSQDILRYCFITGNLTKADVCCAAQRDFTAALAALYANLRNRSMLGKVHRLTLPVMVFFMLILLDHRRPARRTAAWRSTHFTATGSSGWSEA